MGDWGAFRAGYRAWETLVCGEPFTWDCSWALSVIACESTNDPTAVGAEFYDGRWWYFYGLFQIAHPDPPGPSTDWLLDPWLNTVEAHIKYVEQGPGAWPNCGG